MNKMCSTCVCDKVCDHNKYGFENCENYIDVGQIKWERDVAMEQLEKHGIPFCGMADVQAVVRCKDCKFWDEETKEKHSRSSEDDTLVDFAECNRFSNYATAQYFRYDDFCSCGERKVSE